MAAGRDIDRWETPEPEGGYKKSLKVNIIAWYRLHKAIQMHMQDAMSQSNKRRERLARSRYR